MRIILYEAPCIAVSRAAEYLVDNDKCTGCKVCITNLDALQKMQDGKAKINPLFAQAAAYAKLCRIAIRVKGMMNCMIAGVGGQGRFLLRS